MGIFIIKNINILTSFDQGEFFKGDLKIDSNTGKVLEIGENLNSAGTEKQVDMSDKLVTPGLVVGHHHLYSALARGMPAPRKTPENFLETLKYLWWILDRALNENTVYLSGMAGLLGAARLGVTGVIDHHASPSFIEGSLFTLAKAFRNIGLRGMLSYEVTDRNGKDEGIRAIQENADFAKTVESDPQLNAAVGAHASFTIKDSTMDRVGVLCHDTGLPLHIHLLESGQDRTISIEKFGYDPLTRLEQRGLLREQDMIVHGVDLKPEELQKLNTLKVNLLHNPRSNMNNRVGRSSLRQGKWAIGTDGIDSDILAEVRTSFFRGREDHPPIDFSLPLKMLKRSQQILGKSQGIEISEIKKGSVADFTFFDYHSPTPLNADNFAGHVFFGLSSWAVCGTMVGGKWIMQDRKILSVDEKETSQATRLGAKALYLEMEKLQ
ncbi:MAG: amidohydrolase family protein [Deltaproteobacteria bacterium]|nr:amidohydrolase family protein [Deltaproteobacteria bacterium]